MTRAEQYVESAAHRGRLGLVVGLAAVALAFAPVGTISTERDEPIAEVEDDDDDETRRARWSRDARAPSALPAVRPSRAHDGATALHSVPRAVFAIDDDGVRLAPSAPDEVDVASASAVASARASRLRRHAVVLASLRVWLARDPVRSPEVPPRAGPDPPRATCLLRAISFARETHAELRASEAPARRSCHREDRFRSSIEPASVAEAFRASSVTGEARRPLAPRLALALRARGSEVLRHACRARLERAHAMGTHA